MRRQTRASGNGRAVKQTGANTGPDLVSLMRDFASDEKAGVNASLGFTYQHWYAALLAIERFGAMDDYLIILEFKEDVAIVDSSGQPSRAEFHQVKKNERSGSWTLAELLASGAKKSGEKTLSTMAKLVSRRHQFHPHPTVLWFASNVGFKLPLEEGATPRMTHNANLLDVCGSELSTLRAALARELNVDEADIALDDFRLIRTGLPLDDPHRFVAGALAELSEQKKLPFELKRPVLGARMVANQFAQAGSKNSYAKTFEQLQARGVSRRQVADILVQVENFRQESSHDILKACFTRLDAEAHDYETLDEAKSEVVRVCADLTNRTNIELRAVCVALAGVRDAFKQANRRFAQLGGKRLANPS
ncbi:hypothetical protein PCE31106_04743 [Pandoraea cepalis]|uniref:CD-NTase associated protein 4-like DNA endonuclease domain-containing protein n=1 Tax=Pandoraea cepalis TaxID=2508294 RepID=A0A5E4YV94_9BURK|nr:hypothetical protein PCE31106_04743 [Pandoraea cepalis]